MADPKPRISLRLDTLASALEQKLDNEAAILDLLVSALSRGQATEAHWEQLHAAAQRDDRLAELAFAYERLSRDKKLKSLTPAQQATVLAQVVIKLGAAVRERGGQAGADALEVERQRGVVGCVSSTPPRPWSTPTWRSTRWLGPDWAERDTAEWPCWLARSIT